jgi:hypothetical protein
MNLQNVHRIIEAGVRTANTSEGRNRIENIAFCTVGYAEPGYSDPKSGIIAFGNWNDISRWNTSSRTFDKQDDAPCRVAKLLEKRGVELEWEDEWATCDHCGKAVRTKPESYSWRRYFAQDDNGITCGDCINADPTSYLESLEGKADSCLTISLDLEKHGYVLLEGGFEHGFQHGQDAEPVLIAEALQDQGVTRFLFDLDSTGQFDISFSVWVHQSEITTLDTDAFNAAPKDGPSVARGLRRSLQDANTKMAALPNIPGHPKVAKCDVTTGTSKVKLITPQDFVEGKALNF